MKHGNAQAVTEEEHPDSVYPTNCFGTFYVISSAVRDKLYKVGVCVFSYFLVIPLVKAFLDRKEKIFKIDDVFVTGILAKEANVKHK